ncbi:DNA cytosine methyltransferase [Aquimarina gracilis]|uniref:DNA (cytosine-5-)-methyltransferase n=1 Tax=Aquimarina gracilis TaxID=874422 RepID=A0ABU5ZWS2_9FLAO|nr:DNA cytosine methyltransferase [Aquimarina gracilis]MEB3346324.1 DNA cytosine methyltransferase [Aquimarina gracilis]
MKKSIVSNGDLNLFTEHDAVKLIDHIRANKSDNAPLILWVDLFCGCGGVTEGYSQNENNFIVACVNHDPFAIKSHHANHPKCIHYTEDIRDWTVIWKIQSLINQLRSHFPEAYIGLHASLECTHFSKAKGGLARDADSRTLADHLFKYLCFNPDYITIENVEEFLTWGPVDENGKPVKDLKAVDYNRWVSEFESLGFQYDYKILNAADFGAYTSRKRYFGMFTANCLPICFPDPTHVSRKKLHLHPELKPHNAVREKLNLENEGKSLFGLTHHGKEYSEATFWRVYHGLIKFHKEGCFTIRYNGGNLKEKSKSLNNPLGTILTNSVHSLIHPVFLTSYYGQSKDGNGVHSLDEPCNTITTKDRFALHFLQYSYTNNGKGNHSNLNEPANSITTNPKHNLVTTKWLFDHQFKNTGNSVDKPCPTIIARQDKKPLYVASANNYGLTNHSIPKQGDNEVKTLLRSFMREHGIFDIKIRPLEVDELLRIQGFPDDYKLEGGVTRAKKYIGNSVCPPMAKAIGKAISNSLKAKLEKVA